MPSTTYYWDEVNDNLFGEEDENGEVIASYTHEPGRYGELIAQERNGEIRYYNYDGLGNTSELTDEDGNVTDTYEYSAFGEEVARTGTTENPFGYKGALGYYANGDTNDIYVRARVYEPVIGRWKSPDPLGLTAESNLYDFCRNNSNSHSDPSGLLVIRRVNGGPIVDCPTVWLAIWISLVRTEKVELRDRGGFMIIEREGQLEAHPCCHSDLRDIDYTVRELKCVNFDKMGLPIRESTYLEVGGAGAQSQFAHVGNLVRPNYDMYGKYNAWAQVHLFTRVKRKPGSISVLTWPDPCSSLGFTHTEKDGVPTKGVYLDDEDGSFFTRFPWLETFRVAGPKPKIELNFSWDDCSEECWSEVSVSPNDLPVGGDRLGRV